MADSFPRRLRAAFPSSSAIWTRPFLLVCGTQLLVYCGYAAVNPTFATFLATVTPRESLVGVAFATFTFAAVAARPVAGWLLDRTTGRALLAGAVFTLTVTTLSYNWGAVIWTVIVLRALHGIAWGVTSTATPTIAADVTPAHRRSRGLAYFGVIPNVALIVMPPVALLVAYRYGFDVQFAGAAVLVLLAFGPLAALRDVRTVDADSGLYAPEALPAAVLVTIASVPVGAIDALVPLYAPTVGLDNAGLFFTIMGIAIVLVRVSLGILPDSVPLVLMGSFGLQALGLAVLGLLPRLLVVGTEPLGVLLGAALFGAGFASVFPVLQSVAVTATPGDRTGSATATVLIGLDIGVGLGAIIFGIIAESAGFAVVYVCAAVVSLCGSIATGLLRPRST